MVISRNTNFDKMLSEGGMPLDERRNNHSNISVEAEKGTGGGELKDISPQRADLITSIESVRDSIFKEIAHNPKLAGGIDVTALSGDLTDLKLPELQGLRSMAVKVGAMSAAHAEEHGEEHGVVGALAKAAKENHILGRESLDKAVHTMHGHGDLGGLQPLNTGVNQMVILDRNKQNSSIMMA